MFRFFQETETHEDAKTMAQYDLDLLGIITEVKQQYPNADQDEGFKQAAVAFVKLQQVSRDLETAQPWTANTIVNERRQLMATIGKDKVINVTGDASRLLAEKYCGMLQKLIDKEYWPSKDCPSLPFVGTSFETKYAESFEKQSASLARAITTQQERITTFRQNTSLRKAM